MVKRINKSKKKKHRKPKGRNCSSQIPPSPQVGAKMYPTFNRSCNQHPVLAYIYCILTVFLLIPSLGMKDSLGPLKALVVASSVNAIGHVVLCNMLHYGITGAAWATMTSQVCSMNTKQLIYMVLCINHFLLVANS